MPAGQASLEQPDGIEARDENFLLGNSVESGLRSDGLAEIERTT
jgi:hypothetical protein